jgi:hypothetical protein
MSIYLLSIFDKMWSRRHGPRARGARGSRKISKRIFPENARSARLGEDELADIDALGPETG